MGNTEWVYYDDGDPLTLGEENFAAIADFDPRQGFVQLKGTADLCSLDFFTLGTGEIDADLIFDSGETALGEVIATFQDVSSSLSLTDASFVFV